MLTPHDALFLLVLPFVIAGAIMLLAWRRRTSESANPRRTAWVTPLALATAILAAGLSAFPPKGLPKEAMDWLVLLPAIALLVGLIAPWLPTWATELLVLLAGIVTTWILERLLAPGSIPMFSLILLALAPAFLFSAHHPAARRLPPITTLLLWLMLAGATVIVESAGSAIQFGQYTLVLLAALAAILLMRLFIRPALTTSATAAFLLLWLALLTFGYLWADVPASRTFLVALAPLAAWPALFLPRTVKPLWRSLIALTLVAIPLALAAIPAASDLYQLLKSQTEVGGY